MKLYHFSNRVKADSNGLAVLDPNADRNSVSRRDFQTWDQPRTFFYVDPDHHEQWFYGGAKLFEAWVHESSILNLKDAIDAGLPKSCFTSAGLIDFDGLKAHADSLGKIGLRYTVGGRPQVVIWVNVCVKEIEYER